MNASTLRVRLDNPTEHVRGPARGDDRQKPFLRPNELVELLSCEEVPRHRRVLYALAAYTGMRAGEIRGLHARDVDLNAMQIHVTKQATRTGKLKGRTKTGRARIHD